MNRSRYHPVSIALHWLMFLLFVAALACVEIRGWVPKSTGGVLRDQLIAWHKDAGLLVLLFAVLRVCARLGYAAPAMSGDALQIKLAHALHGLLYMVMFLLPITGVVFTQAGGHSVALFNWVLPQWLTPDPVVRHYGRELHGLLGNAVYFLVGAHILAALWHHFFVKDDTLRRMWFK